MNSFRRIILTLAVVTAFCAALLCAPTASATGLGGNTSVSSGAAGSSSDPDADVSQVIVSSNPQETLGTVSFSESNTKRITVGKSTVLYLIIKDMGYNYQTTFETSDPTIATVKKIDNRAVKVVGLKSGTVTITATVPKSKTVTVSAKYVLEIGEGDGSSESDTDGTSSSVGGGILRDDDDNTDLDLFSSTTDPMLLEYAKQQRGSGAASLLLGIIGWGLIIFAVGYVFSVVIRNRTPKMNVSPGSRRRYSAGGSGSLRSGSRLLPDRYYRNLKKY